MYGLLYEPYGRVEDYKEDNSKSSNRPESAGSGGSGEENGKNLGGIVVDLSDDADVH